MAFIRCPSLLPERRRIFPHYIYDENGNILAAIYKPSTNDSEQTYYYAHNWRGDVIALYDSTGTLFATYDYDAWGKVLRVADANDNLITSTTNFANINHIYFCKNIRRILE